MYGRLDPYWPVMLAAAAIGAAVAIDLAWPEGAAAAPLLAAAAALAWWWAGRWPVWLLAGAASAAAFAGPALAYPVLSAAVLAERLLTAAVIWALALAMARARHADNARRERLQDIYDTGADWHWEMGPDLRLTAISRRPHDPPRVGSIGMARPELAADYDPNSPRWIEHLADLEARRPFRDFIYRIHGVDDAPDYYVSVSGKPVFSKDGRFLGYRGVSRDVTKEIEAEEALRASETRFRDYAEVASDDFWETDAELRFISASGQWSHSIGMTRTEVAANYDPESPQWRRHLEDLSARRPFRDFVYRARRADGSECWRSVSGKPMFDDAEGFIGYRGTGRDVTTEIEARAALRASEQRFRDFTDSTSDFFWEMGADLRFTHHSAIDRRSSVIGRTRQEVAANFDPADPLWIRHLEDLRTRRAFRDFLVETQERTGERRWWKISGKPVFGEKGVFLGYRGTGNEVTAAVAAEQAQRELATVFESASDAMYIRDPDGFVLRWNKAAEDLFGWSEEEMVGVHFRRIVPDEMGEEIDRMVEITRQGQALRESDTVRIRRDGRQIDVSFVSSPITDGRGKVEAVAVAFRDITERKLREAELDRFAAVVNSTREAVGITDLDGRIVYVNPACEALLDCPREQAMGRCWHEFVEGGVTAVGRIAVKIRRGDGWEGMIKGRTAAGRRLSLWLRIDAVRDAEGAPTLQFALMRDNSLEESRQQALRDSEDRAVRAEKQLRAAMDSMPEGVALWAPDGRLVFCNQRYRDSRPFAADLLEPGVHFQATLEGVANRRDFASGIARSQWLEGRLQCHASVSDGDEHQLDDRRWIRISRQTTGDGHIVDTRADITALKEAERRLVDAIDCLEEEFVLWGPDNRLVMCNENYRRTRAAFADKLVPGVHFDEIVELMAEFGPVSVPEGAAAYIERRKLQQFEGAPPVERARRDGTWVLVTERKTSDGGTVGVRTDITAQKKAEQRLLDAINSIEDGFVLWDADDRLLLCNDRFRSLCPAAAQLAPGITYGELLDREIADGAYLIDGDVDDWRASRLAAHRTLADGGWTQQLTDGRWMMHRAMRTADGGTVSLVSDVTAVKRAELRLYEAFASISDGFALYDAEETLVLCNQEWRAQSRCDIAILQPGVKLEEVLRNVVEVAADDLGAPPEDWLRRRLQLFRRGDSQFERLSRDGRWYRITATKTPNGDTVLLRNDITARKEAEQRLRQAQRMEAVGHLTGGIAHDFNNLLTVVVGNLNEVRDLMSRTGRKQDATLQFLDDALSAGRQGAELIRRLMAFGRHGPVNPQPTNLNTLIEGLLPLLKRTVGVSVLIRTTGEDDLANAAIDPLGLETALINIAVNARDAMPNGGRLTIETREAHIWELERVGRRGDRLVVVAVRDTGVGMAQDVRDRVFDPFFTTKDVGQGSGLGLSTVYGFMKQIGGEIEIDSEPGQGTEVRLFVPADNRPVAELEAQEDGAPPRGDETVLVVEDDVKVRRFAATCLQSLGYRVLQAPDAKAALKVLQDNAGIDLLFSDILMPGGLSGLDLAERVRGRWPSMRVLMTTGYNDKLGASAPADRTDLPVLFKPYDKVRLARRVREAIDNRDAAESPAQ